MCERAFALRYIGKLKRAIVSNPGSHLLSHAVSSIVSSAAQVLTIVFGMGTRVSQERIATGEKLLP